VVVQQHHLVLIYQRVPVKVVVMLEATAVVVQVSVLVALLIYTVVVAQGIPTTVEVKAALVILAVVP
jgi:hypothetical protein